MSKKSHHFLTLWPWPLTYDLEKLIRSGHYHYQCVYQIWEQPIPWFLSYRVNTIAGGGRLRRKTITSPDPSDTGDIKNRRLRPLCSPWHGVGNWEALGWRFSGSRSPLVDRCGNSDVRRDCDSFGWTWRRFCLHTGEKKYSMTDLFSVCTHICYDGTQGTTISTKPSICLRCCWVTMG